MLTDERLDRVLRFTESAFFISGQPSRVLLNPSTHGFWPEAMPRLRPAASTCFTLLPKRRTVDIFRLLWGAFRLQLRIHPAPVALCAFIRLRPRWSSSPPMNRWERLAAQLSQLPRPRSCHVFVRACSQCKAWSLVSSPSSANCGACGGRLYDDPCVPDLPRLML